MVVRNLTTEVGAIRDLLAGANLSSWVIIIVIIFSAQPKNIILFGNKTYFVFKGKNPSSAILKGTL